MQRYHSTYSDILAIIARYVRIYMYIDTYLQCIIIFENICIIYNLYIYV
jgi:hypothetical protein